MSQSDRTVSSDHPSPVPADKLLPPVEPPSAGFIVQLFVIPGLIVLVIVMVWLMFSWVARSSTDAKSFLVELKRNTEARWQAALNLASAVHADKKLRRDDVFARELSLLLEREFVAAETAEAAVMFRVYLCRALGEFDTATPIDALLKTTDPGGASVVVVRCAAIQAIATLTDHLRHPDDARRIAGRGSGDSSIDGSQSAGAMSSDARDPWSERADVAETLLKLAEDREGDVRSNAAFALGVMTSSPPIARRLHTLINDSNVDARCNAATALARNGDAEALPQLMEMIDPESEAGVSSDYPADQRAAKRAAVRINGLRGIELLATKNADVDRSSLVAAVEKLRRSKKLDATVEATASKVLAALRWRP